jgi:hypothetical protein
MGARLRRSGKASIIGFLIAIALIGSAWLAYATTAPSGTSSYPTTTVQQPTTTVKVTTTTVKPGECKPGYGYGDKNHCHTGPPGQNK